MSENLKYLSKREFNTDTVTLENIQTSCMMRMADAAELMASNYVKLQQDMDYYKRLYRESRGQIEVLNKKISSLRGVITRMKNQNSKR